MTLKARALLPYAVLLTGCSLGFPRGDVRYAGTGDARIVEFMRGNYMSGETGIAMHLKRHLEEGLPVGRGIDRAYLVARGAACTDVVPVVCMFNGVADERFSGIPRENAWRAHRVTRLEARLVLVDPVRIEVVKEASYPDMKAP